jgi:hypothetical protein
MKQSQLNSFSLKVWSGLCQNKIHISIRPLDLKENSNSETRKIPAICHEFEWNQHNTLRTMWWWWKAHTSKYSEPLNLETNPKRYIALECCSKLSLRKRERERKRKRKSCWWRYQESDCLIGGVVCTIDSAILKILKVMILNEEFQMIIRKRFCGEYAIRIKCVWFECETVCCVLCVVGREVYCVKNEIIFKECGLPFLNHEINLASLFSRFSIVKCKSEVLRNESTQVMWVGNVACCAVRSAM